MSGVYVIINRTNGKMYVGQTQRKFSHRWNQHKASLNLGKHHNKHLQNAWNKYGEPSFEFVAVETCPRNKLQEMEQFYIDKYGTKNPVFGYNKVDSKEVKKSSIKKLSIRNTGSGNPMFGRKHSEKTKKKIGEKSSIKKHKKETKKRISEALKKRSFNTGGMVVKGSLSNFVGVSWNSRENKWKVGFHMNHKDYHIGYSKDERTAAILYNEYIIKNKINRPLNNIEKGGDE